MLPPEQRQAFNAFHDRVRSQDCLDQKTTTIIGLAAAMAAGCQP